MEPGTGPPEGPPPKATLFDAGLGTDGDQIWVVGGHVGSLPLANSDSEATVPIEASNEAVAYDSDGNARRTVRLPVPAGAFLFAPSVEVAGGDRYVVGGECALPGFEPGGCGRKVTPAVFRLGDGNAAIRLPVDFPPTESREPGAGWLQGVGAIGDTLVVVQVVGSGGVPGIQSLRLFGISPSGAVEEWELPGGVLTASSLCTAGDALLAAVPELTDDMRIRTVGVLRRSADGAWSAVGRVTLAESLTVGSGVLRCGPSIAVLALQAGSTLYAWPLEPGDQRVTPSAGPVVVEGQLTFLHDSDAGIIASVRNGEEVRFLHFMRPETWGELRGRPSRPGEIDIPAGVWVGGVAVDASVLVLAPPERQRAAPRRPSRLEEP